MCAEVFNMNLLSTPNPIAQKKARRKNSTQKFHDSHKSDRQMVNFVAISQNTRQKKTCKFTSTEV